MQLGSSIHTTYTLLDYNNDTRISLNRSAAEKDLGVWYSIDLKSLLQCNKAADKALKSLGLLKRTFRNINVRNFPFLYKTYGTARFKLDTRVQHTRVYYPAPRK